MRSTASDTVQVVFVILQGEMGDLNRLAGLLKMQGFMRCLLHIEALPAVLNDFSDLLIAFFGDDSYHARIIYWCIR